MHVSSGLHNTDANQKSRTIGLFVQQAIFESSIQFLQ